MNIHLKRPYFQSWYMAEGDRYIGFRVVKKGHEEWPTIDIYWWWGGVMIFFAGRYDK